MDLRQQAPRGGDQALSVEYLLHRVRCAEAEAEEAESTAGDGGDLAFARLRRNDAAGLRSLIARRGR